MGGVGSGPAAEWFALFSANPNAAGGCRLSTLELFGNRHSEDDVETGARSPIAELVVHSQSCMLSLQTGQRGAEDRVVPVCSAGWERADALGVQPQRHNPEERVRVDRYAPYA